MTRRHRKAWRQHPERAAWFREFHEAIELLWRWYGSPNILRAPPAAPGEEP